MAEIRQIVLATKNPAKLREMRGILRDLDLEIVSAEDVHASDVEETGDTFEANARLKALSVAQESGLRAIADDSGLEVPALGNAPGVYSSRYSAEGTDAANNALLLAEIRSRGLGRPEARFVCVMVLADPQGVLHTCRGEVEGRIVEENRGEGGFGYDPVFFCPELGKTFGEAASEEKESVSHRGRALRALAAHLMGEAFVTEKSRGHRAERWVKENIEAIAVAVVMALVIRQFAVEAFMIPTESMAPTLLGKRIGGGTGDRILVDKVGKLLGGPERFDVVVFKYPLNASKNYIKRLVGLSGETLTIRDGDVLIDGKIVRKPPHAQEVLFFPVYPGEGPDEHDDRLVRSRWSLDDESWTRDEDGGFTVRSEEGDSYAVYDREIRDATTWDGDFVGRDRVGDVRLSLTATADEGVVLLRIAENLVVNELSLAVGEGSSKLVRRERGEVIASIDLPELRLEAGEPARISFANVDDTLLVTAAGEKLRYEYESPDEIVHRGDEIRFGVRGASASFRDVRIDRDVHYIQNGNSRDVRIPQGHFFVLGDNSRSSKDSRQWKMRIYELPDGRVYRFDNDPQDRDQRLRSGAEPGTLTFVDYQGVRQVVKEYEFKEERRRVEPASFVPRENLIGRAFFVFWPINALRDGGFRMKLIR